MVCKHAHASNVRHAVTARRTTASKGRVSARNVAVRALETSKGKVDVNTTLLNSYWDYFAECVTGEWQGKSAAFSPAGAPLPLPERYVPPEYGQWGIELKDWATLSSVQVADGRCALATKFMFPTVGCEADAASFVEDKLEAAQPLAPSAAGDRIFVSGGSFSAGPEHLPTASGSFYIESCFMLDSKQRVRVRHRFDRYLTTKPFKLQRVELFAEGHDGAYNGGRELPLCCGSEAGFSGQAPLKGAIAARRWQAVEGVVYGIGADGGVTMHAESFPSDSWRADALKGVDVVCFPLGVWSRVAVEEDQLAVECGVLRLDSDELAMAAQRVYRDGQLLSASVLGLADGSTYTVDET